ncbi:hypothetical protein I858_016620 (plasmid) [Planococcus versutus]|uniref:Uncharacterized protein n=1 Tax=Planococcus versutus TaxID=1302659 RepID=A0A1B1S5Z1_9BACL|nr:hypothetical protein I858_016620 [Planococcus versutus]
MDFRFLACPVSNIIQIEILLQVSVDAFHCGALFIEQRPFQGTYQKTMKAYRKVNLLKLEEWMLVSLTENEARDVLEIVEARYQNATHSLLFSI